MRIFFLTWTYPGPNLQSLDLLTALSARLMIPIFKFYSAYKYASAITEVPIKLLIVMLSNININIKHTCFLIPPWSWYLFSDQLLIIQPEFLMLGHTKPNSHCIKTKWNVPWDSFAYFCTDHISSFGHSSSPEGSNQLLPILIPNSLFTLSKPETTLL